MISPGNIANFGLIGVTDGVTYKSPGDPTRDWTFTLPTSQDYQITVTAELDGELHAADLPA